LMVSTDGVDLDERRELLALAGWASPAGDGVAAAQPVFANLRARDMGIVRPGQVAVGANDGEVVDDVEDPGHGQQRTVLMWLAGSAGVGMQDGDVIVIHRNVFLGWLIMRWAVTEPGHAGYCRGGFPFAPGTASPQKPRPAV
jgi:hypothetical protein